LVNDLLVEHFPDVVDVDFTANMEEELDEIARGERQWVPVVREFYEPFQQRLEHAEQRLERVKPPDEPTDEVCEKCGRNMVIKLGRFGRFLACPGFPECRNAKSLQVKLGVPCPECGGEIVEKRTRTKRVFYGCAHFPTCNWTSWAKPVPEPCPTCGGLQVEAGRDRRRCLTCSPQPEPAAANGRVKVAATNGAVTRTRRSRTPTTTRAAGRTRAVAGTKSRTRSAVAAGGKGGRNT
jgi:DNA topoisomerase-1